MFNKHCLCSFPTFCLAPLTLPPSQQVDRQGGSAGRIVLCCYNLLQVPLTPVQHQMSYPRYYEFEALGQQVKAQLTPP